MSDNTGSKMFFSFLFGATLGAGLAFLFAPQAGKETRRQIKDFSDKLGSEVKDFSDKLGGEVREGVEKFSGRAKTFIDDAKDTISKKSKV